jgi:hypothetical protein
MQASFGYDKEDASAICHRFLPPFFGRGGGVILPHHAVLCSEGNTLQMAQPGLPGPTRAEADPGLQFNRAHVPLAPARRWHLDDTSFQCLVVSCVGHSASEILSCDPWGGLRLLAALDPPYGCMDRCPH